MPSPRTIRLALVVFLFALALPRLAAAVDLQVVSTTPVLNTFAPRATTITVTFDKPLKASSIDAATFRVFGRGTGTVTGAFSFSNANQTVTLTPTKTFSAGEVVTVNLSHDVQAADNTFLRS